jgi:hypothetical protein
MNQFKIPSRMGVEQLMENETSKLNASSNSKNPNTKYIVLGVMIIASIGVGLYIASQYEKPEKN